MDMDPEQQQQQCLPFSTAMGLLTTVAQLPPKYKIRYLAQTIESPLDLSIKQTATINTTEFDVNQQNDIIRTGQIGPMTPPPSPPKKRYREEDFNILEEPQSTSKYVKAELKLTIKKELTPNKPIRITSTIPKTGSKQSISTINPIKEKKSKAIRKLKFDEETSSPVSGTIIRPLEEIDENSLEQSGDIDPQYNIVEVTDEAKAELASIRNVIGAYVCKLCRNEYEDAFGLARHRCSCIVLLEYRCPECGKRFNCPANLASHRRWHKPKDELMKKHHDNSDSEQQQQQHQCNDCGKTFKRIAYLRKHILIHKKDNNNCQEIHEKLVKSKKITKPVTNYKTDDSNSNSEETISNQSLRINSSYKYDFDMESTYSSGRSDCSSPGRLRIVDSGFLTEEENIAATALAHLRNGPSVIQHTTAAAMAF